MCTSGFYAWDESAMQVFCSAENIAPRFSPAAHTPDVDAQETRMEDIIETPIDPISKAMHVMKILVNGFDLRKHTRKKDLAYYLSG